MGHRGSKKYTREEQKVIIEEIQQSPHNLRNAFERSASRLRGRNKSSISGHYYSTLRPLMDKEGIILTELSTVQGTIHNTKTVARRDSAQLIMVKQLVSRLNSEDQQKLMLEMFESL